MYEMTIRMWMLTATPITNRYIKQVHTQAFLLAIKRVVLKVTVIGSHFCQKCQFLFCYSSPSQL